MAKCFKETFLQNIASVDALKKKHMYIIYYIYIISLEEIICNNLFLYCSKFSLVNEESKSIALKLNRSIIYDNEHLNSEGKSVLWCFQGV